MAENTRQVAILVESFYQELEVWYPLLRLREAGVAVVTVGPQAGVTYNSKLGYPVKADRGIGDVSAAELDGVVIPGGWAPDYLRRDPRFVQLVRDLDAAGQTIASICHGGWLLCSAGILRHRRATSFFAIRDDMTNAGARWVDEPVVVDANLITSRVPEDLPWFCRALMEALAREPKVVALAQPRR